MNKKTIYELRMDDWCSGKLYFWDKDKEEAIEINAGDEAMCKKLGISLDLLETLAMLVGDIDEFKKELRKDLIDLYEKLEALEEKVGK